MGKCITSRIFDLFWSPVSKYPILGLLGFYLSAASLLQTYLLPKWKALLGSSSSDSNSTTTTTTTTTAAPTTAAPTTAAPTTRVASSVWKGSLVDGSGKVTFDSSTIGTYDVNWPARVDPTIGVTSPEELLGAAHSSCYCMALSHGLTNKKTPPTQISCKAEVDFTVGVGVTNIRLFVSGDVPGLDAQGFREAAEDAKANCPMSQALKAVPISLVVT